MVKRIIVFIFVMIVMLAIPTVTLAENFTYRVYNPNTKQSIIVNLGTARITQTQYLWMFYNNQSGAPYCLVAVANTNIKDGLVGGNCIEANAFIKRFYKNDESINLFSPKYQYSWRELSSDTFFREKVVIERERALQGYYEYVDR